MDGSRTAGRRATWSAVSERLGALGDADLGDLLRTATEVGSGIGGASLALAVDGTSVFVKVVPLTELEQQPAHVRSTANLFGLPSFCHYGVGSPGFTAWRELEVHERTTRSVLDGQDTGFPLLYHWRVLPADAPPAVDEHADPEAAVAFWHGAAGVADRLAGVAASTTGLVLFLEHVPHQLDEWLRQRLAEGGADATDAIEMVDATLLDPVIAMNRSGLFHFDSHLRNLLTDGEQVLATDFGLATARDFDLAGTAQRFLDDHELHDASYTVTRFVNRLVTDLAGLADPAARNAYIVDHATDRRPTGLPPAADAVVRRYAPVARIINAFYWRLFTEARDLEFPTELLHHATVRASLPR